MSLKLTLLHKHLASIHGLTSEEIRQMLNPESREINKDPVLVVLPWSLLPPDHMSLRGLVSYYESIEKAFYLKHQEEVDQERLKQIISLSPNRGFRGPDEFLGYVVYEFDRYEKVVLDCPVYGNAVYLLYKDRWRTQARQSKQYIRENYPGLWSRVLHTDGWLQKVRMELRNSVF